jgi:hypothetical protein
MRTPEHYAPVEAYASTGLLSLTSGNPAVILHSAELQSALCTRRRASKKKDYEAYYHAHRCFYGCCQLPCWWLLPRRRMQTNAYGLECKTTWK